MTRLTGWGREGGPDLKISISLLINNIQSLDPYTFMHLFSGKLYKAALCSRPKRNRSVPTDDCTNLTTLNSRTPLPETGGNGQEHTNRLLHAAKDTEIHKPEIVTDL